MKFTRAVLSIILGKRLPILKGTLEVQGISAPVLIRRDSYGIPYIQAKSEADAFYALGFCQGQDRSFQIERLVRTARSTLLQRRAEEQLALLEGRDQELLKAFAAGINAGVEIGCRRKAPEFSLLRIEPSQIQAADALGILNFVALILSPWPYKINRFMVLREYGSDALKALDGAYPDWLTSAFPVNQPAGPSGKKIAQDIQSLTDVLGFGISGGSNSWAVNASRSATGRPILANDPHLSPTIPSHWYIACLETPEYKLRGATLAGTPFFSIGHNQGAAWGVTGGSADNTDLFLEELDDDGLQVREEIGFQPLEITSHTIQVKGQEPFKDRILNTPRGPIISDVLENVDMTLSIRSGWMQPRPIQGLFEIYRVQNFQDFQKGWLRWYQAAMNMIYADTGDNIGWQFIGDFPDRKSTTPIPIPGWEADYKWDSDQIPGEEMPHGENPPQGYIATANTKPIPGEKPYLGYDFADGYRLARIIEVLDQRGDWDLPSLAALQEDVLAIPWREIREIVLGIQVEGKEMLEALALLHVWDGRVSPDSPAASVYEYFLSELVWILAEKQAPECEKWVLGVSTHPLIYSSLGKRQVSHLSRLLRSESDLIAGISREELIRKALSQALLILKAFFGDHPADWAWGQIRPLTLEHPFGGQPVVGKLFTRGPFPWGGDSQTVSQATRSLKIPTHNPTGIANLRMVLDVGEWENNLFVLAGGQSGNPFSPHYDDQIPLWQKGEGITLAWGEEAIEKAAVASLQLKPK
jgi:penicillin amidase